MQKKKKRKEKGGGHCLELLLKFRFWKELFFASVWLKFSVVCGAGKVDRSQLWHVAVGQVQTLSWSTVDLGNGDVTELVKGGAFSTEMPVVAQKCKMGSAGHQSPILGCFHACGPPSLQAQPDWVWAGLLPTSGFPTGPVALLWFCGRAATVKIN